ncbi:MAG: DoxX family protein [Planctomycetota bacterium]
MKRSQVAYWVPTGLFCFAMGSGGIMNLMRVEAQQEAMSGLGYPAYLMTILGVAKVAGAIALVVPGMPVLKEWAYAGFTFDLLGASASHAFSQHSIPEIVVPLVVLAIAAGSYWLRPDDRRILSLQSAINSGPVSNE